MWMHGQWSPGVEWAGKATHCVRATSALLEDQAVRGGGEEPTLDVVVALNDQPRSTGLGTPTPQGVHVRLQISLQDMERDGTPRLPALAANASVESRTAAHQPALTPARTVVACRPRPDGSVAGRRHGVVSGQGWGA